MAAPRADTASPTDHLAGSALDWYESLPRAADVRDSVVRPLDEALAEVLGREPGAVRRDLVHSWRAKRAAA